MTKSSSTQDIAAQLAKAEAEAARLREHAAAIAEAEQTARDATELRYYRDFYGTQLDGYRERRDAAMAKLDELAAADRLDLAEAVAAFDELQRRDAQAAAAAAHTGRLDGIDPLPDRHNGAPRTRPPRVQRLYAGLTFTAWLDGVIAGRAQAAHDRHLAELQAQATRVIDEAAATAREQAANGEPAATDTPASIRELAEQAGTPAIDEQAVAVAGLRRAELNAEQAKLDQLVAQGN
ncbi:hypothetical protein BMW24_004495 [Mycobacterium heckeshornense]|uniref:hypothetical protein n=1 Tax=Mycobacterium heckeshornense TaxID=110505 RepID=UPI000C19C120|nr:hypothetical protein [Mycobacterium heckeshornense]PIJ36957.1 hypothetical protein BMW24_004495 [Mycobacterium heckeshornense]